MPQSPLEFSKRAESDWSLHPSEASNLDPELIRSVPLEICLAGWGKHFRTSGVAQGRGEYELSQVTDHIDDFLSHDWKTSRFDKVLAMLWTFNCWAALVSSTLVSCLTGVLRIYANSDLGNHWWPVCFGYLAYGFTLCFWQRIRSCFWKSRQVFLDRLCISQEDEALKRQGRFRQHSLGSKSLQCRRIHLLRHCLQILRDFSVIQDVESLLHICYTSSTFEAVNFGLSIATLCGSQNCLDLLSPCIRFPYFLHLSASC